MDFELSDDQRAIEDAARAFAAAELAPHSARWDEEKFFPVDVLRQAAGLGFAGIYVREDVGALSGGQRQAVAIARSLLGDPSVVLLDEPTAALGVSQTEQVLQLIHTLRERGLGVVVISHNLENVFAVADRIIVLRLGKRAATFDVRGVSREDVVSAITGAEFGLGHDLEKGTA